jgi:hypothetical protein
MGWGLKNYLNTSSSKLPEANAKAAELQLKKMGFIHF